MSLNGTKPDDELGATSADMEEEARRAVAIEKVAEFEVKFAENPDDENVRRQLHAFRVMAGWRQFLIDTVSGVDPRTIIPWVAILEIRYPDEWKDAGAPSKEWLKGDVKIVAGGKVRRVMNPRICEDGKWRRDVSLEADVVAVEDLDHLCSIVERMEDVIIYKPDETGLPKLSIFDARQH